MSKNIYQTITDQIIAKLESNIVPWQKPWNSKLPTNIASNKAYTGINVWLLAMKDQNSSYWGTFKQIKELGGSVVKGSKSTEIVFCKRIEKTEIHSTTGKELDKSYMAFKSYRVFNLNQTTGLDYLLEQEADDSSNKPVADAEALIANYLTDSGVKVQQGGVQACYLPAIDTVVMPNQADFVDSPKYYSTLYHELAHSTGHKSRLDRFTQANYTQGHAYSFEELIAEFSASYLSAMAGIQTDTLDNSASYIRHWISKLEKNEDWLVKAASAAQKGVNLIVEGAIAEEAA